MSHRLFRTYMTPLVYTNVPTAMLIGLTLPYLTLPYLTGEGMLPRNAEASSGPMLAPN